MKGKKSLARTRDAILDAMQEELDRCKEGFSKASENLNPYFIAFGVRQKWYAELRASSGCLEEYLAAYERQGRAEVRVGSYDEDGMGSSATNQFAYDQSGDRGSKLRSLKKSIRRDLWYLAEEARKLAMDDYNEKHGKKHTEYDHGIKLPDFSRERPITHVEDIFEVKIPTKKWEGLLRDASAILYTKGSFHGKAKLDFHKDDYYHVDSEGRKVVHQNSYFVLALDSYARGIGSDGKDDGTVVNAWKVYFARKLDGLPSREQIISDAKKLSREAESLRRAPLLSELRDRREITCPAIFNPHAFGFFLHESLGHRLELRRTGYKQVNGNALEGLFGHQILPEFMSIYFDPSIKEFPEGSGQVPFGHYNFDAEAIKGKRVQVVKDGKLVNYLLSRAPVFDLPSGRIFSKSNGHARLEGLVDEYGETNDSSPRMSTLVVESKCNYTYDKLKSMAKEECRKKGCDSYVEVDIADGGYTLVDPADTGDNVGREMQFAYVQPYKIYLVNASSGKRTLIRGAGLPSIPLQSLKSIMATSSNYELTHGTCGSYSGWIPVSEIGPSALIKEVTLVPIEERNAGFVLLPP